MKDLIKTAGILDKICAIIGIAIKIGLICMLVGLCLIGAGFLFDLEAYQIGANYSHADLGFVTLVVTEQAMPDYRIILGQAAMEMFLAFLCLIPAHFLVKSFRAILAPMRNGAPFHNTVSLHLGKMSRYICALGIGMNLQTVISNILLTKAFDLPNLLRGENIEALQFMFHFDLSFLFYSGILLLLSYIFRYGEQLQQLSDETL